MMNTKYLIAGMTILFVMQHSQPSDAQTVTQSIVSEDFTGATTTNSWYFFNGACLTASSASAGTSPGPLPGCLAVKSAYYHGENLVGGQNGVSGGTTQTLPDLPDPITHAATGALRFTNGYPFGNNEGGAIISSVPFDATNGVQITFKSVTYRGDSQNGDGADGISFFLVDGSVAPSIGSQGGSLAYTCSNPGNIGGHSVINGVTGGYLALGIDEYGNFLNSADNTVSGVTSTTNSGTQQQQNRIGLRGAGNVSWGYLSTNLATSTYYPPSVLTTTALQQAAVAATCKSGTLWDYRNPSNPIPVLTAGTTVTGTLAGKIKKNSNQITGIPSIPASLIIGATITDPLGFIPSGTIVTFIGTNTVTMSNQGSSGATSNGTVENNIAFSSAQPGQSVGIADYPAITNGSVVLSGLNIANESAMKRGDATPIFYNLKITPNGLLSVSYSLSGAAYQPIITNHDITLDNGPLPTTFRFGFAGSTGGATNIHEIMCFKAAPQVSSGSSATVNEKESAKVETTTQAFFAFYDPNDWTGSVTANTLLNAAGVVTVKTTANWDASCLLTGTTAATGTPPVGGGCPKTGAAGPTSATPAPASRVMLTWDGNTGVPFLFTSPGLSTNEQNTLDALDASPNASRMNFLRGARGNELSTGGVGVYRKRAGVLGDIVDSSPTWVGPPILPYTASWTDLLQSGDSMVENSGTQNYLQFVSAEQSRLNVVYVGANDGFLHGFRAGRIDSAGNLTSDSTTPNDGQEVLAYMPGALLQSPAAPSVPAVTSCTDHSHTQTVAQNIHGVTPIIGANALCVDPNLDYASPQYGHNFFVDATPGTGDLFYGGTWHTWLVGGLGAGGSAIYALDITNPDPSNFTQGNASSIVLGEWNASTLNTIGCASTPTACGGNLGNTFGTPQIRRLHNGKWGAIFGNGFGSTSGDAGIYVMTVDVSTGKPVETFYYLSTHQASGSGDGIAYVTPADLDGDHITDYVYAGDLHGNVWRFDLTSTDPTQWAAATAPLFTTPAGQPITTQLLVISTTAGGPQRLMIEFATGQRTQVTNTTPVSFASGTQAIYGIWDWNLTGWNGMSSTHYLSLTQTASGLSSPTIPSSGTPASLAQQTFTINTSTGAQGGIREGTNVAVCWKGSTVCTSGNNHFGWYVTLPGSSGPGGSEQVIFNPVFFQGAILVDSTLPASNIATSCSGNLDSGFTYAINVANGGIFTNAFPTYTKNGVLASDSIAAGIETGATGSVYVVTTVQQTTNIIYQTVTGSPSSQQVNIPANTKSKRLTWVERR
jgi:type IV pilus assembly protein PilY1